MEGRWESCSDFLANMKTWGAPQSSAESFTAPQTLIRADLGLQWLGDERPKVIIGTDQNCKGHWHEIIGIELYFIFINNLKWLWVNVLVVWAPCNYKIHSNRKGGKIDSRWEQCCLSLFLKRRTDNHVTGKWKRQIQEQILELQLKKSYQKNQRGIFKDINNRY